MPATLPPYVCNPMNGTVEVHAYSDADGCRMSVDDVIRTAITLARHPEYYGDDRERHQAEYRRWATLAKQAWAAEVPS